MISAYLNVLLNCSPSSLKMVNVFDHIFIWVGVIVKQMKATCPHLCLLLEVVRRLFETPFLFSIVSVGGTGEPALPDVGLPAVG